MTKVYLIRHGQTEWNQQEIFRGQADVPLDETGQLEARALADRLRETGITAIFCSPLLRAEKTAEIIAAGLGIAAVRVPELTDIDCGGWQGLTLQEVKSQYITAYQTWLTEPDKFTFPKGENLARVRDRVMPVLFKLTQDFDNQAIAIVAHRVINKVIICTLLDLPNSKFWSLKQDTAALNLFDISSTSVHLIFLNDTCHLERIHGEAARMDF